MNDPLATPAPPLQPPPQPPPRAFMQGAGTVYQFTGVILFLFMMFICCGSGLLSKDVAVHNGLANIGWRGSRASSEPPIYSAQMAITCSVMLGITLGMAVAAVGLGMQAQTRRSPLVGLAVSGLGTIFWLVQTAFAIHPLHSILLTLAFGALALLFCTLFALAVGAAYDVRCNPPRPDLADLPADYVMPHSHLGADPPEVRLARELAQRRQRLEVQQKELEQLEARLKRRLADQDK